MSSAMDDKRIDPQKPFARDYCNDMGGIKQRPPSVRISIAAGASMDTMESADIPGMIAVGVEGINLMTYDFFGTPWAEKLAHHTNLYDYEGGQFSIDKSVRYLLSVGVPSKNIFVGYVAYSRIARNAVIESWSPLVGTYHPGTGITTGSYESGASDADCDGPGRHGRQAHHDAGAARAGGRQFGHGRHVASAVLRHWRRGEQQLPESGAAQEYRAKWWVSGDQEPGDPNVTSTIDGGDSKPWLGHPAGG